MEGCTTTYEAYTLQVTDNGDQVYEKNTVITGSAFIKSNLPFARVRTSLSAAQTLTSATLLLNSLVNVPIGGKIVLDFPTGFSLGAVAVSGHSGIDSSSTSVAVSGMKVTVTIATSIMSAGNDKALVYSAVTTPMAHVTGTYTVKTTDSYDATIEERLNIPGEGCYFLNYCNGHGTCTLLSEKCMCYSGWGAESDVSEYKSPDCSLRVCPSGKSWTKVPTSTNAAHTVDECSGMGTCDRATGDCNCFSGYTGSACQRLACPNQCSGHGQCFSMQELAQKTNAFPLSAVTTYTGAEATTTWDQDKIFGCVCDSSWTVGLGSGERQLSEWFGADCSKRRCPSGNDPTTSTDETDCNGVVAYGGVGTGSSGNLCHVECSNQGICDYSTGICKCLSGFTGLSCNKIDVLSV